MALELYPPRGTQATHTNNNAQVTTTTGTSLTTGGSAHTLGASFVDLANPLAHDCHMLDIAILATAASATRTDALLNIYVGTAGNEVALISGLPAGWSSDATGTDMKYYRIPVFIPAGTRVSAKAQALQTSKTVRVLAKFTGYQRPPFWFGRGVEILGVTTASSTGTSVTPGTASEGSFTNIGTTTYDWGYILPIVHGTLADTTSTTQQYITDIGVGGSLYNELSDFFLGIASNETGGNWGADCMGTWCPVPAGTTLQLRSQCQTDATPADFVILGVY